jgi:hypothetical protein
MGKMSDRSASHYPAGLKVESAVQIIRSAIQVVPATKYALAVAGVAAASAIVRLFAGGDIQKGILAICVMFVFMVAMLLFARLARLRHDSFRVPALAMLWSMIFLFVATSALALSCVFFRQPLDWSPPSKNTSSTGSSSDTSSLPSAPSETALTRADGDNGAERSDRTPAKPGTHEAAKSGGRLSLSDAAKSSELQQLNAHDRPSDTMKDPPCNIDNFPLPADLEACKSAH